MTKPPTPRSPPDLSHRDVEVLVVGLGPAGSTALRRLAQAGISAIGVDRAVFPREKPCGGGLSARTLPLLPKGVLEEIPYQTTRGVSLTLRGQRAQIQDFGHPIAYQVRRDQFDLALLNKAQETGIPVRTGVRQVSIARSGGRFEARIDNERVRAGAVIAADGATSKVLRDLDPESLDRSREQQKVRPWTSAEGWATLRHPIDSTLVAIDLGLVSGGYAWSFPKKDSLWGLGVAGFLRPLRDPKAELSRYLKSRNADLDPEGAMTWVLPNFRSVRHGRVPGLFLVGDAGGVVDPFLGEGIYYAILSGNKAAECYISSRSAPEAGPDLSERASQEYARWINGSIWPDFRQGSRLAQAIYRFPEFFFGLTGRYPRLLGMYASIMTGKHDYRSFSREIILRALGKLLPWGHTYDGRAL